MQERPLDSTKHQLMSGITAAVIQSLTPEPATPGITNFRRIPVLTQLIQVGGARSGLGGSSRLFGPWLHSLKAAAGRQCEPTGTRTGRSGNLPFFLENWECERRKQRDSHRQGGCTRAGHIPAIQSPLSRQGQLSPACMRSCM